MLGEHIATIGLALLYLLSIFGWGSLLLKLIPAERSPWDTVVSGIVAGCGVLYALFIGLGAVGVLRPLGVGIVLGLGLLVAAFSAAPVFKLRVDWQRWELADRVLLISVLALGALQLIFALTPLIFYDLQVYHFLAPAQFLRAGSLVHIPWNVLTNSPLALQLTVGMSLVVDSSGQLAKLLLAILGCLLPLSVFELVRPAGRRAALLASLFVLCFPEFWLMQTLGAVDVPIAGLMIFGTLWLRRGVLESQWWHGVLSGIAFGIAIGSRYQAAILTAWIVAAVLAENFIRIRRLPDRRAILQLVLIGLVVALLVCPWMIRNYVHMGNPVYPLMHDVWGGAEWSGEQAARLSAEALGPQLPALSAMQRILAPFMTLLINPSNGLFGMALLFGALIALAVKDREVRLTALLGLGGLLIWGLLRPTAGAALLRYNLASIAFLLAATGAVLAQKEFFATAGPRIAAALASGSLIIAMFHVGTILPVAKSLTDSRTRHTVQEINVPGWAAFQYVNEHLSPDRNRVLLIGETRGFWLRIPYIAPSSFNGPQLHAIFDADPEHWKESLAGLGVTHLLISGPEVQRLRRNGYLDLPSRQMEAFDHWVRGLPHDFEDGRGTFVLALEKPLDELVHSN